MAKLPRKGQIGWRYEVDVCGTMFQVAGPGLGNVICDNREDAEMIVAALNFSTNFEIIRRASKALQDDLTSLSEFK